MAAMLLGDLGDNVVGGGVIAIPPSAVTATGVGNVCDMASGSMVQTNLAIIVGAVTGTSPTLQITVEEANNSVGSYVSNALPFYWVGTSIVINLTAASANTVVNARWQRQNRYVLLAYTIGGTSTPTFNMCAVLYEQLKVF